MAKRKNLFVSLLIAMSVCFFAIAMFVATPKASAYASLDSYAQSFVMDKGAKVLLDGENTGLRFTATMDSDEYDDLVALNSSTVKVKFGVIILPYDYVTVNTALTEENLFGASKKYCFDDAKTCECGLIHISHYESSSLYEDNARYPGKRVINCSIINIIENNIPRPFVGVGYVSYLDTTDAQNPVSDYVLASFYNNDILNNVRSPLYVAQVTYEVDELTENQEKVCEDDYFAPFASRNFVYTVNYNFIDRRDNSVIKSETVTKYAPLNSKITAPDYDGDDDTFDALTKVEDSTEYTVYNENKTVITVNYVNDTLPVIKGNADVAFVGEAFTLDYTATDVFGKDVALTKVISGDNGDTTVDGNSYTFTTAGTYTLNLSATDEYGNSAEKSVTITVISEEDYAGALKVSAYSDVSEIVGRAGNGSSVSNFSFNDNSGYSAAYLKTVTGTDAESLFVNYEHLGEEDTIKTPTVFYGFKDSYVNNAGVFMSIRVGLQTYLTKADLMGYKKYSGMDKLYLEFYNAHLQYPNDAGKVMKKLTGVNADGTGIYENFNVTSSTWITVEYDLDMLIENYETIFYKDKPYTQIGSEEYYGLVLLSAGGATTESSAIVMNGWQNQYFIGGIYISSDENLAIEKYVGVDKLNAVTTTNSLVGRVYDGYTTVENLGDAGGYTSAYLKGSVPTESVDGKMPVVAYNWLENKYLSFRLGLGATVSKADLELYKTYSNIDTLYVEFYMAHTSSYGRKMKVLTGVNTDGSGIYEFTTLRTNQWLTLSYDLDMLIANYDTIFNPSAGLVLVATPKISELVINGQNDYYAVDYANVYYVGEVFFVNADKYNEQKYGNVVKVSAITGSANVVAKGYAATYSDVYTSYTDAGGVFSSCADTNWNPTDEVGGKVPTIKVGIKTDMYLAVRFGLQPSLTKEDLINYKKYSGLTKLCVEFYNEHSQYPTGMKKIKVLTGVNTDGSGIYTFVDYVSGTWHTIEFDIQMLIDNYDTIFAPDYKRPDESHVGLCLICSANSANEGSSAEMVGMYNTMYLGEIYLGK